MDTYDAALAVQLAAHRGVRTAELEHCNPPQFEDARTRTEFTTSLRDVVHKFCVSEMYLFCIVTFFRDF